MPRNLPDLSTAVRMTVLVVALEPAALRPRVEASLVLLGIHAEAVDAAIEHGLLRALGDRLEAVDHRLALLIVHQAADRERRSAHLALACTTYLRTPSGRGMVAAFDQLRAALDEVLPAGADPHAPPGPQTLTRQERHVAELAATGVSTREIAAAAFLSPKTVEYHLTRVYRKLGVRSKAELAFSFRSA